MSKVTHSIAIDLRVYDVGFVPVAGDTIKRLMLFDMTVSMYNDASILIEFNKNTVSKFTKTKKAQLAGLRGFNTHPIKKQLKRTILNVLYIT